MVWKIGVKSQASRSSGLLLGCAGQRFSGGASVASGSGEALGSCVAAGAHGSVSASASGASPAEASGLE